MGEAQAEDPQAARFAEQNAARDSGGFWRTLPGLLTAAGSFLAGLAGLAAVIVPNIVSRPNAGSAATPIAAAPSAQAATAASADIGQAAVSEAPPAAPARTPAPPADAAPALVETPPADAPPPAADPQPTGGDRYVAAFASDGFVVLRGRPTTDSAEVTRILVGVAVRCGAPQWVADGYRWRRCVDQDGRVGFMSDTFLRKA